MVNVRVAQDHRIDLLRIKRECAIPFDGLTTPSLKQATFQKQTPPIHL